MDRKISHRIMLLFPAALTAVFFVFMYMYSGSLVDSDDAGELILSELMSREHGIMSVNWYYSTEIRFLNSQVIFAPLFYIFKSWRLVRSVGSTLLVIIYELCAYALGRSSGLSKEKSILLSGLVVLPLSGAYFHYVMFGSYYIPHIAISFGVITLINIYRDRGNVPAGVLSLCGAAFLSFAACVEGPRQILCLVAPLLVSAMILRERRLSFASALCLLLSGAGYLTNKALASVYTFSHFDNSITLSFSLENLKTVIKSYLTSYGFRTDRSLLSPFVICDLAALAIIVLTVISVVRLIKKRREIHPGAQLILTFFLSAICVYTLFICLTGFSNSSRYNMQITIYSLPLILLCLEDIRKGDDISEGSDKISPGFIRAGKPLLYSAAALTALCGAMTYAEYIPDRVPAEHILIAKAIEDSGCSYAYSTFWNGNVLTELSDGRIEVHVWPYLIKGGADAGIEDPDSVFPSLQMKAHGTDHPSGPVCCVFDEKEKNSLFAESLKESEIIYHSDSRTVYKLPSYEEMAKLIRSGKP
ncbi:MAG: hypothetical protein K6E33_03170 [Lachnospiraceae bacterium]|nr:hypothetical protein [Lachnospiraceae bacterium]